MGCFAAPKSITYNHLNLPQVIGFENGNSIEFVYTAAGTKLRKTVKTGGVITYEQDYVNGIEYRKVGTSSKVEAIYHQEGRRYNTNVTTTNSALALRYEFSLRDHLGNTRLTFTDKDGDGVIEVTNDPNTNEILQENHYYPFGLALNGPWMNDAALDNRYQYNGKELDEDFGLKVYHYGARIYDPAIGRFSGVDPISDKFPWVSTYNYAENEPVRNIDLHGLQKYDPISKQRGPWSNDYIEDAVTQQIRQTQVTEVLGNRNERDIEILKETGKMMGFVLNIAMLGDAAAGYLPSRGLATAKAAISFSDDAARILSADDLAKTAASAGDEIAKLLTPVKESDNLTLFRGTTGTESTSKTIFLTNDPSVAQTYVRNGGEVVQYNISSVGAQQMEWAGQLNRLTGIHGPTGKVSTEYQFIGKEVVKFLNSIAKPIN